MKDNRDITMVEHSELEGVIHWCDPAWALSIPGLPELGQFPAQISCHYGASKAERPYLKQVTYFPDLRSFRHDPDAAGFRMTYRSVYDGRSRIILSAAADGSQWRAEKFVGRREIGLAIGRPGDQFFLHLSLVPIPEDEKCFTRDWPAEEIAALTSPRLPDPAGEAEKYLLAKLDDPNEDPHKVRLNLVGFYGDSGRFEEAMRYAQEYLAETADEREKAEMVFRQGQLMENIQDWEAAVRFYSKALEIASAAEVDRYFIYNNLGYSLVQLGRYAEAEPHLREAIRLDASRANAFKNLGLSLQGQGRFADAARSFIDAVRANAADSRALGHLEVLASRHKEIITDLPDLDYQIFKCREAVEYVAKQRPANPHRIH